MTDIRNINIMWIILENEMNITNSTEEPPYEYPEPDILFLTYYYGTLLILSAINIVGNSMLITGIIRHPALRIPSNYFIFSLACSDLLLGFIYPVYNVAHLQTENIKEAFGNWHVCTFIITFTLGVLSVSSFNLVGIIAFRFLSVKYPLTFHIELTHAKALAATGGVWIGTMVLTMAFFLRPEPPDDEVYQYYCRYEEILKMKHIFFSSVISYFIPVFMMAPMYGYMVVQARKQSRRIADLGFNASTCHNNNGENTARQRKQRSQKNRVEVKLFKMATLLFGYFTLSWIPITFYLLSYVGHHYDVESNYTPSNDYIRATVRILLHSNSAVNVWIYAGRMQEFKDCFRKDCLALPCCQTKCCQTYCCKSGRNKRRSSEQTDRSIRSCRTNTTEIAIVAGVGPVGDNRSFNGDSGMESEFREEPARVGGDGGIAIDRKGKEDTKEAQSSSENSVDLNVSIEVCAQNLVDDVFNDVMQHCVSSDHSNHESRRTSLSMQIPYTTNGDSKLAPVFI